MSERRVHKSKSLGEALTALRALRASQQVHCDYCGQPAKLVTGKELYGPRRADLMQLRFWRCKPCDAHVGVHKNSPSNQPLGRLANAELRRWKMRAHEKFDKLWREFGMSRSYAYKLLSAEMGLPPEKTHIGMFDERQCELVTRVAVMILIKWKRENDDTRPMPGL